MAEKKVECAALSLFFHIREAQPEREGEEGERARCEMSEPKKSPIRSSTLCPFYILPLSLRKSAASRGGVGAQLEPCHFLKKKKMTLISREKISGDFSY